MDPQLFRRPSNESFQPHENQTSGNSIIQNPRFVIAQIIILAYSCIIEFVEMID